MDSLLLALDASIKAATVALTGAVGHDNLTSLCKDHKETVTTPATEEGVKITLLSSRGVRMVRECRVWER